MSRTAISIILADDHQLIRKSWKTLLENNPGFTVVADCRTGENVLECVKKHQPDILIVDITLSPEEAFQIVSRITKEQPAVKIIGLSVNNQPKYAVKMMALGARGYITKTSSLEEITRGITEVHHGNIFICEEVQKLMPAGK